MVWVFWLVLLCARFSSPTVRCLFVQQYAPSLWAGFVNYVRLASLDLVPASRFRGEGNASPSSRIVHFPAGSLVDGFRLTDWYVRSQLSPGCLEACVFRAGGGGGASYLHSLPIRLLTHHCVCVCVFPGLEEFRKRSVAARSVVIRRSPKSAMVGPQP